MKTRLRRALAMIALIAFVVTMLPLSAFAEARTSFIRSRIDSRPARPDIGIEIVPPKTENPKRSAIWDGSIAAGFAGGSGTEDDPYLISNGPELAYLAQQVNSGNRYENVHFKLTNDIYLNDTTDWELWGTTGSSSAGKADTRDEVTEPTEQNKGDKMDEPIAIPVRPAPKTELESDALSDALNAAGQSNTFVSTGSYPWMVDSTTYDGRTAAQSGNYNVSSSTSSFSTTVTLSAGDIVSFEYCVSSESNYDKFKFSVNDSVVLTKSGLVSWNSYSYQATADGEYTFLWSYTKDGSVNGNSDACWVDNVYIGAPLAVTGIDVLEHLDIPVNGTGTVAYSVLPENAYNKNVSFESADAGIAAVNANGVVTGVSAGETTITVTTEDGGFTGACTINVYNQAVTGVTIEPSEAELTVGSSTKLTATVLPENATNKNVIYSVDDESILSVDQDGNVTGLSLGTATVTVTTEDGGFTASAEITVYYAPANTWTAIGTNRINNNGFCGVFNGDGYAVRGIYINTQESYQGLFGNSGGGSIIANLGVAESYIYGDTYVGGVVGYNGAGYNDVEYSGGTVTNCYNTGSVTGKDHVGGVAGINEDTVTDCYNVGSINGNKYVGGVVGGNSWDDTVTDCCNTGIVTGKDYVGGVVGENNGTVTDCCNTSSVTGKDYVGGVVGYNAYGTSAVTDCYNTGIVIGERFVGGVIGYLFVGTAINCYNEGSITGERFVGGVIGDNEDPITACYNTGIVSGVSHVGGVIGNNSDTVTACYNTGIVTGGSYVGGVAGYNWSRTFANCYNTGSITGGYYVGGVVGYNKGNVTVCYNTGSVTSKEDGYSYGGVAGYNWGTITDCYNEGSITGEGCGGGVVGCNRDTVIDCYNTGIVTGVNTVSGVVGENMGTVTDCYNEGSVNGNDNTGGVVGFGDGDGGTVTDCYNTGNITGNNKVGGVVGGLDDDSSGRTVIGCYNTGIVTGISYVGGVIGENNGTNSVVTDCYNTGGITGGTYVGGVVGHNSHTGSVTNCYNTGSVTGDESVGGVVGLSDGDAAVTNCYYYVDCCANSDSYGTALTNEQMLRAESFEGFDFETVWTMDGNPGYPYPKLINNFHTAVYAPIANSGDANGDGTVNAVDALVAMRYVLGVSTESLTPEQIAAADFNGDGAVNAVDAMLIMRFSLGLIEAVVSDPE